MHIHWLKVRELSLTLQDHQRSQILCVDRGVADSLHHKWNTTDVIEVTVRDDETSDLVLSLLEVLRVRKDIVDTWSVALRRYELESNVKDDDIVLCLNDGHVTSDLLNS